MGVSLRDLIGNDGELKEPYPPGGRKNKGGDDNNYFWYLALLGIMLVLALMGYFFSQQSDDDDSQLETRIAIALTNTQESHLLSLGTLPVSPTRQSPTLVMTPSSTRSQTPSPTIRINRTSAPTFTPRFTWTPRPRFTLTSSYTPIVVPTVVLTEGAITIENVYHVTDLRMLQTDLLRIYAVAWSPDSQRIVAGGVSGNLMFWDVATGTKINEWNTGATIYGIAWSFDGKYIATGHRDSSIRVWDVATGTLIQALIGHRDEVLTIAWSPIDPAILASGSADSSIYVWNVTTGNRLASFTEAFEPVDEISWSPDGNQIVAISLDHQVRIWDLQTGKKIRQIRFEGRGVAWSPNGHAILMGGVETGIIWSLVINRQVAAIQSGRHEQVLSSVAWSPDGSLFVSASWDRTVRIWDSDNGLEKKVLDDHSGVLDSVAWSPDGKYIVSAGDDVAIIVWGLPE